MTLLGHFYLMNPTTFTIRKHKPFPYKRAKRVKKELVRTVAANPLYNTPQPSNYDELNAVQTLVEMREDAELADFTKYSRKPGMDLQLVAPKKLHQPTSYFDWMDSCLVNDPPKEDAPTFLVSKAFSKPLKMSERKPVNATLLAKPKISMRRYEDGLVFQDRSKFEPQDPEEGIVDNDVPTTEGQMKDGVTLSRDATHKALNELRNGTEEFYAKMQGYRQEWFQFVRYIIDVEPYR